VTCAIYYANRLQQEQKLDEAVGGGARGVMLAHKPLNFEKCPLVFTVDSSY